MNMVEEGRTRDKNRDRGTVEKTRETRSKWETGRKNKSVKERQRLAVLEGNGNVRGKKWSCGGKRQMWRCKERVQKWREGEAQERTG